MAAHVAGFVSRHAIRVFVICPLLWLQNNACFYCPCSAIAGCTSLFCAFYCSCWIASGCSHSGLAWSNALWLLSFRSCLVFSFILCATCCCMVDLQACVLAIHHQASLCT